jgi:hypothetical protein
MVEFATLPEYRTEFPQCSFLGTQAEALALSPEHQAQIHFLNPEATAFIQAYLNTSYMFRGGPMPGNPESPFHLGYFKQIDHLPSYSDQTLKKWLYRRGIPFGSYVLLYVDTMSSSRQAVWLTWKMVLKYADGLFGAQDQLLFDQTLNWGLFYDHWKGFSFGRDKVLDNEVEYQKMAELAELKRKYPFIKTPY